MYSQSAISMEVCEKSKSGEDFLFDYSLSFRGQHLSNFVLGSLAIKVPFKIENGSLS